MEKKKVKRFHQLRRKLHINGEVWTWEMHGAQVLICSPIGEKFRTDQTVLTGASPDILERADWKGYSHLYSITPSRVKEYIQKEIRHEVVA